MRIGSTVCYEVKANIICNNNVVAIFLAIDEAFFYDLTKKRIQ